MQKNNNEEMFNRATELTDLAAQIEMMWLYLDTVDLNDKEGAEVSTVYFMKFGLDTVVDNLAKIKKDIEEISNQLMDGYDEENELTKSTKNTSLLESLEVENNDDK